MSIFDSIMGNISSLGDALDVLTSATGAGTSKSSKKSSIDDNTGFSSLRASDLLSRGNMALPYTQGKEFTSTKTRPAEQVDAETINQQWLNRLNKYSSIASMIYPGAKASK